MTRRELWMVLAAAAAVDRVEGADKQPDDLVLQAMREELERARTLALNTLDKPYFIEYGVVEGSGFAVQASLGALVAVSNPQFRIPSVRVRVGNADLDNTNYIYSDYGSGSRYDPDSLPIDNDLLALRRVFWLATDRAYKTAVEAIARKRSTLKNISVTESLPDFWKASAVDIVMPLDRRQVDAAQWTERIKRVSAIFRQYPEIVTSSVSLSAGQGGRYLLNSEGTRVRVQENLHTVQVRASAVAQDGAQVRDSDWIQARSIEEMPSDAAMNQVVERVAKSVRGMAAAPMGEPYNGPVLFEGMAGAQLLAELFGSDLAIPRRPVSEPGRPLPFRPSELEGRIGSRIFPEFINIVDDPTLREWNSQPLIGGYPIDEQGVVPKRLELVKEGKLQSVLLTRQPIKGFDASNGHARLPGAFGNHVAIYSNLIASANEGLATNDLRKKFIDQLTSRNKPYGIIVRKMDYPSSAAFDEIRRIAIAQQSSGSTRPVSIPLSMFRVFPDGREEQIRGLQFRGLNIRAFRDVVAASKESFLYSFLLNLAPFSMLNGSNMVAPVSVVAPSLLFDDLELERPREDRPKPPVVPPPPIDES